MENISAHITYEEATRSNRAKVLKVENKPSPGELENMKALAINVFEPLRAAMGVPITISSMFRSAKLNVLTPGSSATSQHCKGEAIDIVAGKGVTNRTLFLYIYKHLTFDQLIWESGNDQEPAWVHVSYSRFRNRKQVLKQKDGRYANFIPPAK